MNWYKQAAYSHIEDLLNQLLRLWEATEPHQKEYEVVKLRQQISKAYNNLVSFKDAQPNTPEYPMLWNKISEARGAIFSAKKYLATYVKGKAYDTSQEAAEAIGDAPSWFGWEFSEERGLGPSYEYEIIPSQDPATAPPTVKLPLVTFNKSQMGQNIISQMHGALRTEGNDSYLRGTKEVWDRFVGLSKYWAQRPEKFPGLKRRLPSEEKFGTGLSPVTPVNLKTGMEVFPLNLPDQPDSIDSVEIRADRRYPGMRLKFDTQDPQLYDIRDAIVQSGKTAFRVNIPEGYFDIFEAGGKKSPSNNTLSAQQWVTLKKKLQNMGYQDTGNMSPIISTLTGIDPSAAAAAATEEARSQVNPKNTKQLQNRLASNIIIKDGQPVPRIAERLGVPKGTVLTEKEYSEIITRQYPGAFGENIPTTQQDAQRKGMYFAATRNVSIIADEAGAGKTCEATVAADSVREEGKKILVISPNAVVSQNWIGPDPNNMSKIISKAPGKYCNHGVETIKVCLKPEDILDAATDPKAIWIILPASVLQKQSLADILETRMQKIKASMDKTTSKEERRELRELASRLRSKSAQLKKEAIEFFRNIKDVIRSKIFSALIIDEIQQYKNPDSLSIQKMCDTISKYDDIPHRIGLSGTPSDNNPTDIFSQMLIVGHRVLFQNKGKRHFVLDFNSTGFAEQFLGGIGLSEGVTIQSEERHGMNDEEIENIRNEKWNQKIEQIMKWVESVENDDERKLLILELFASTYLRREKKDIRPDIPPKTRSVHNVTSPPGLEMPTTAQNWHVKLLHKMAVAKQDTTSELAYNYLKSMPAEKVFIVTKHPKIAIYISDFLNNQLGDGAAAAIHGGVKEEMRNIIAEVFRQPNGVLPGKQVPLRAAVYTMKLGAVGLDFDVAHKAIFNDMDWNPSNNIQAEFRVHRITSRYPVNVEYVVFDKSYDMEMYNRVFKKEQINDAVANIIKQASTAQTRQEKLQVANVFIRNLVESVMLDVNLSKEQLDNVSKRLGILFGNAGEKTARWYAIAKHIK